MKHKAQLWLHGFDAALQRPWVRRGMVGVILAWAFLATVVGGAVAIQEAQDSQTVKLENAQILHACERDNVKTANDNASHWGDYNVFKFVVERFSVPTKSETAAQKRITADFAGSLRAAIGAKDWTPLTNCTSAVAALGAAYKAPLPVPFSKGRPPANQLDPTNAVLLDPKGSVP